MKLLNKLTLKNLRLNKVRTIVTIVGIMRCCPNSYFLTPTFPRGYFT